MTRLFLFFSFCFSSFSQVDQTFSAGCFDDNYTIQVGMSLYDSTVTDCIEAIVYLNNFGLGCDTYLSEINNPFWGSNPNETIANICGCTCAEVVIDILGCVNTDACNYNSSATVDDGSCEYPELGYDCEGNCLSDLDGDGICDFEDDCPLDPNNIVDCNGECGGDAVVDCNGVCEGNAIVDECGICEGSGPETGYDCEGNCLSDLDNDGICDFEDDCPFDPENDIDGDGICSDCDTIDYIIEDCECEFLDPATYTVFYIDVDEENCITTEACYCECYNDIDNDGICDENEQVGCTDYNACNYDSNINPDSFDDGSCIFPGDECIAEILEGGELIYGIFNEDCICLENNSFIEESCMPKKIIKVVDLLGRDVIQNGFIIKIYNNGTVERLYTN